MAVLYGSKGFNWFMKKTLKDTSYALSFAVEKYISTPPLGKIQECRSS